MYDPKHKTVISNGTCINKVPKLALKECEKGAFNDSVVFESHHLKGILASDRSVSERAFADITSEVVNIGESRTVTMQEKKSISHTVGQDPTMTFDMHDHEAANSCSCMEEHKEGDIRTILRHQFTASMLTGSLNETRETSAQ